MQLMPFPKLRQTQTSLVVGYQLVDFLWLQLVVRLPEVRRSFFLVTIHCNAKL